MSALWKRKWQLIPGVGYAAALSAGAAAIHLAVKLLGIKEGDKVLCSSLTFSASCNPVCYEKAVPVFVDSEPDTGICLPTHSGAPQGSILTPKQ